MPEGLYGIRKKINWKTDYKDGQLHDFLDIKSERDSKRNWISLEDLFWLTGMEDSPEDESNEVLVSWQKSFVKYLKTEDISELGRLPHSAKGMIWLVYAFFKNI